jgi:hypothetical protein
MIKKLCASKRVIYERWIVELSVTPNTDCLGRAHISKLFVCYKIAPRTCDDKPYAFEDGISTFTYVHEQLTNKQKTVGTIRMVILHPGCDIGADVDMHGGGTNMHC